MIIIKMVLVELPRYIRSGPGLKTENADRHPHTPAHHILSNRDWPVLSRFPNRRKGWEREPCTRLLVNLTLPGPSRYDVLAREITGRAVPCCTPRGWRNSPSLTGSNIHCTNAFGEFSPARARSSSDREEPSEQGARIRRHVRTVPISSPLEQADTITVQSDASASVG